MDEIIDILRERIAELGARRDRLVDAGASNEEREANRLEIVELQWELARLLMSTDLPRAQQAA